MSEGLQAVLFLMPFVIIPGVLALIGLVLDWRNRKNGATRK